MALYSYDNPPYKWDPNILKVIRRLAGVSVSEMAIYLRMHEYDYEKIESGEATPDLRELINIADYSGGNLDYLTGRVQDPESLHDKLRIAKTILYKKWLANGRLSGEFSKEEPAWPYNLCEQILRKTIYEVLTEDQLSALEYILSQIDPRERDCILKYYKEDMNYKAIGKEYGLSGTRIQQIVQDGLLHCRRRPNGEMLLKGKEGYAICKETSMLELRKNYYCQLTKQVEEKQTEYEEEIERLRRIEQRLEEKRGRKVEPFDPSTHDPDMRVEDLELSVRSFNCLKRAGIETVDELTSMSLEDMKKIQCLGKKSLEEILDKLQKRQLSLAPNKASLPENE